MRANYIRTNFTERTYNIDSLWDSWEYYSSNGFNALADLYADLILWVYGQ